ncbi:cadherin-89D isoform X2 [Anthonomus grandis grandis]|uniref:cadherin-89D isoform X2 n=1 Tax=Anthonomus grandis grandis TaxID=2921223 RepID=UPI002165CA2A|nr:cadherin-89D isoform X2 [Anthonomus grandis grandis]
MSGNNLCKLSLYIYDLLSVWLQICIARKDKFIPGCQFYPPGEYLRFIRVPENLRVGEEVLRVEVHPRNNLNLLPVDKNEDVSYFTYRDLNRTTVSLLLAKSLEDLVDSTSPRNVLKFKLSCDFNDGEDTITSSLSVTVYIEDINDHAPEFIGEPYYVEVDELFPVGLTLYRGVRAIDRDKPNTPNSDVQFAIVGGNERGKFALDNSHQPDILLRKTLDFDAGDREFILTISATDRGNPPRSTNSTVTIKVNDNDDLPPKFTKGVYRTRIHEFYPITGMKIHELLSFHPPIYAFDQDFAIETAIRYDIIAGNERHLFYLDHVNASLFLEKEIDLDSERSLPGNTFVLQIQAAQVNNPLKTGLARVEVEVIDLNDNLPEFEVDFYNISIVENLPNGFSVLQIMATDQDQGDNADFSYQLEDGSGAFSLDARSGWLTVRDQTVLDREKRGSIKMKVYAKEKVPTVVGNEALSSVDVEVTLLDANDNNPTFIPTNLYDFTITTQAKKGDKVGQVQATDPDLGRNGVVLYSLQKTSNSSDSFEIEPRSGKLVVADENVPPGKHLLFVEATDQPFNPSERRTSLAVVTVEVRNHPGSTGYPEFVGAPYEFWVGSTVGIGTSVGQLRVSDAMERGPIAFDLLHSYHEGVPFAVEESSGVLTVVDDLKKFSRQDYEFEGVATNDKDVTLVTNVTLHVVDPKDEKAILMKTGNAPIEFHVKENQPNVLIGKLGFKNNMTSGLRFSIANQKDVTDVIAITTDGTLHTLRSLDREVRDVYRLTVIAEYNKGSALGSGIYQVTIYVDDENDNKPQFERSIYEGKIQENAKSGTEVDLNFPVHVSDKDIDANGQFTVGIFGNGSENFRLDKNTGKIQFISASTPLDRETTPVYNLRLVAKDKGGLYSEVKLIINIEDENDNPPVFMEMLIHTEKGIKVLEYDREGNRVVHFERDNSGNVTKYVLTQTYLRAKRPKQKMSPMVSVPEDLSVGTTIIKLTALDKDISENAQIKYEMVSETYIPHEKSTEPFHLIQYFMVHPTTGEISVARTLPPESEFRLNVSASDKGSLRDYLLVRVVVKDINDHTPVFKKSWYNFDTEEAVYARKVLGKIEAMDSDFGPNANITYSIKTEESAGVPFSISTYTGQLSVDGILDRETRDKYSFVVVAKDNPQDNKPLSSSVNVEVNVLDVNDNPPVFYGYDDLAPNPEPNVNNYRFYQRKIPVYYAAASENSPIGTPITRVFANDSDFTGNGNGLILFDIPFRKGNPNLFAIDSKEGILTTIGKLDYEKDKSHNVTIVASDLGSPSLSSTAVVSINVIDVPEDLLSAESPVFSHRYYEVEVEENVPVPLKILTLNVTEQYKSHKLRFSIVSVKNSDIKECFSIDPRNGTLFITKSPDREKKALYELVVRLDQYKVGRDMTVMVYPVTNERLGNLGLNEVKVIVRITDLNDNPPKFMVTGRPIVAAIPTTAGYGYEVLRLQASDPDLGLNGEIRFQIIGRNEEANRRFAIDPISGQVRAISNFIKDAGKVFGFDVKATDKCGADDGHSSIANVLVYVLDEQKQVVMVMGMKPVEAENSISNITTALNNATGFDVRIRKLEPHNERNLMDNCATDMYLYAVDPALNTILEMSQLEKVLLRKKSLIEQHLEGPKVLALSSGSFDKNYTRTPRLILSSIEVGAIILGCVVLIGAVITSICVVCIKRKNRRLKRYTSSLRYGLGSSKAGLYPPPYGDPLGYQLSPEGVTQEVPMEYTRSGHDITCPRYYANRYREYHEKPRNSIGIEKSITSLHSSGQDSGIADATVVHSCQCGHSSSRSSGDESSNYEDSLQSTPRSRKLRDPTPAMHHHITLSPNRSNFSTTDQRRSRNRSITEDVLDHEGISPIQSTSGIFTNGPGALRRSTERLMMGPFRS